ncbi:thioester reductase domain-containing protein [Nocardia sp. CDC159]|uniref:Carboxylic acid reductase n=1 Tax=Nocardia pulmonis TaxID=2951408 RepID=A0A9X2E3D3_9NOCA|nr:MULTISPECIES: carboxylic acid reductase [Nocardia]MCM6773164.1 thioester reductase domain-containing protein [Nocardia pulmonis]MCM6785533.1 thioester reductase domain-containing protein [Nocardia sp. CDC159]
MSAENEEWSTELRQRVADLVARDEQVRAALPSAEIDAALRRPDMRLAQIVATVVHGYADRPALGRRAIEFVTDETGRRRMRLLAEFETITYRELGERIGALAAAWHHDAERPRRAGDFVAILGFASVDYTTVDLGCAVLGLVSVPLQAGAASAQLAAIVAETEPRVLATNVEQLERAAELVHGAGSVESLVVFDYHAEDDDHRAAVASVRDRLAGGGVRVEILDEVLARGRQAPAVSPRTDGNVDELALLIYTSGSTGTPKGAMYPERLVARMWHAGDRVAVPSIVLNYLPMSHIAGRNSLMSALGQGGTVYFAARSDMSTLFDDIALARPTVQFLVPRVCDMVFQRFQHEVDRRLVDGGDQSAVEEQVRIELRQQVFGGRLLTVTVGSAPLSAEMRAFVESVLGMSVVDGYGATETGVDILVDNRIQRPPVIDYKLVDVPELGYYGTDTPFPRGELLVKTETLIPGYYRRPELNETIFDDDGFYRTGDVMAQIGPDRLAYVDRRNNVLKLSQGEYVAVSKLEAIYATSLLIRQIYVYGSGERAYLLAVIVPTTDALAAYPDTAELKAAIGASLRQVAKDAELSSYEIPRDFLIETEPFSTADGLLSGIGKLLRPKLKQRYGERLERLYDELARQEVAELRRLRGGDAADQPALAGVCRAVRAVLGSATTDVDPDAHFTDLGGDSLSALSLSNLLSEMFGVEVDVGVIVSAANSLRQVADYIETQRRSGLRRPTATSVHGTGTRIRTADLTLDRFLDAATLSAASTVPPAPQPVRTVLLTGANGYLGRFLCLEWLQRLHEAGGTVICLVRGSTAAAARARLDDAFDSGDPDLLRHFRTLAEGTLEVLPGDIGDPNLGLAERDWRRLADAVDVIVHAAALVNHVLPYGQLFGPNVVGTAEIIRLALTGRRKPLTYLSSVAVTTQIDLAKFTEDGDIRRMSAERSIDDSYANGYGNSKWAGEVLLRQAHDLCGLPVTVFRSDMILAHTRYAGQLNIADMFTRLLLSLLTTGLAPRSFYRLDATGHRQRAHYEGLPVDFTAAAVTTLAKPTGFDTFDVLNPHDDGISLDTFVDWLIEAGHPIDRVDDYSEWLSRFEAALRALPEPQRQQSVLPLLQAYRHPADPIRGALLPAKKFQSAVQSAALGPTRDIPDLTPQLIEKYVSDLKLRKLL